MVVQWLRNLPVNAGYMSFIPGGKIPHVVHEATKPVCHNYWARVQQLLKPVHPRACAPQEANAIRSPRTAARELTPLAAARESWHTATKTQHSQNNK